MKRREFLTKGIACGAATMVTATTEVSASSSPTDLIIDAHCHAGKGMNFGKEGAQAPWTTFNDPQETLRKMEEVGIDRTIIFPISNVTYEKANAEIAEFIQTWPDKLIGFAKHDPETEAGRIGPMLLREIRQWGLKGLKLHGVPSTEMMDAAAESRIPILFHPTRVDDCHDAVKSHPEVNFILAHLGSFATARWQEHVRAIEAAKRHPNLYLETSSVVFFRYLELAAHELPADKLIFGSDGPLVDSRLELQKIRLLNLPPEKERKVLSGNIRRLLGETA